MSIKFSEPLGWIIPLAMLRLMALYLSLALLRGYEKWGNRHPGGLYHLRRQERRDREAEAARGSREHSARAYRAFEFFLAITIPLIGGIGALKLDSHPESSGARFEAALMLALMEYLAAAITVIAVTRHLTSKWERWRRSSKRKDVLDFPYWLEPYMIALPLIVATLVWLAAFYWPGASPLAPPNRVARSYKLTVTKLDSVACRLDSLSKEGWDYEDWLKRKECLNDGRMLLLTSRETAPGRQPDREKRGHGVQ